MRFEIVADTAAFVALEKEWESLEARAGGHLFQNHRFLRSWLENTGDGKGAQPAIALCYEDDLLVGLFPGCLMRMMGLPFLTWMGGLGVVDYGDILLDRSASISAEIFLEKALPLLRKRLGLHFYYLHNVRTDARAYPYLKGNFTYYRGEVAPFVRLEGDFEAYMESLRKFRKNMRSDTLRQIKRISALGEFRFEVVKPAPAGGPLGTSKAVEAFIVQKRRQFEETGVAGALTRPGYADFYRAEAADNPHAHISCLTLDGEVAAVHFGYLYGNRFYYLMPAYDSRFAKYSPGRILTYYLLEHCYSQGVEVFDFALGAEPYKYEWTADQFEEASFINGGILGKGLVLALKGKKELRKRLGAGKGKGANGGAGEAIVAAG